MEEKRKHSKRPVHLDMAGQTTKVSSDQNGVDEDANAGTPTEKVEETNTRVSFAAAAADDDDDVNTGKPAEKADETNDGVIPADQEDEVEDYDSTGLVVSPNEVASENPGNSSETGDVADGELGPVSYTHLTLPTNREV